MMTWSWFLGPTEWRKQTPDLCTHAMACPALSSQVFLYIDSRLISSSSDESPSPLSLLVTLAPSPSISSHLSAQSEVSTVGFGWLIDSKGLHTALLYIHELIFLFYQKAHLFLYGKLYNHFKLTKNAKWIVFCSSWYTVNLLSVDNMLSQMRSHKWHLIWALKMEEWLNFGK